MTETSFVTSGYNDEIVMENTWISVKDRTHMVLAVRACAEVKIYLSAMVFNIEQDNYYLITIDDNGNLTKIEHVFYFILRNAICLKIFLCL